MRTKEGSFMTTNKENPTAGDAAPLAMEEKQIVRKLSLVGIAGNIALSAFKIIAASVVGIPLGLSFFYPYPW